MEGTVGSSLGGAGLVAAAEGRVVGAAARGSSARNVGAAKVKAKIRDRRVQFIGSSCRVRLGLSLEVLLWKRGRVERTVVINAEEEEESRKDREDAKSAKEMLGEDVPQRHGDTEN